MLSNADNHRCPHYPQSACLYAAGTVFVDIPNWPLSGSAASPCSDWYFCALDQPVVVACDHTLLSHCYMARVRVEIMEQYPQVYQVHVQNKSWILTEKKKHPCLEDQVGLLGLAIKGHWRRSHPSKHPWSLVPDWHHPGRTRGKISFTIFTKIQKLRIDSVRNTVELRSFHCNENNDILLTYLCIVLVPSVARGQLVSFSRRMWCGSTSLQLCCC